jgi:hypothetical protein
VADCKLTTNFKLHVSGPLDAKLGSKQVSVLYKKNKKVDCEWMTLTMQTLEYNPASMNCKAKSIIFPEAAARSIH